jgi:hypothetical protein
MPAGTLTLTNNSAIVKGTGTAFNTELKAGDFIVSVVGGVTYTLPVKTVDSATQVTLIKVYDGPTQAGAAWYAVPREMQNSVTAQLVSEATKAMRGMNYDKENWQQLFSGSGNITVKLPDGSTFTGPAWNSFTTALNLKADKTELDKKADKTSLGNSATRDVGTASGTVAAGNDARIVNALSVKGGELKGLLRIDNRQSESGGTVVSNNSVYSAADGNYDVIHGYYFVDKQYHSYRIVQSGNVYLFKSDGNAYAAVWNNTSDGRLKLNKSVIKDALDKINSISGYTYIKDGVSSTGLIAQEVEGILPEVVSDMGDYELKSDVGDLKKGSILKNTKAISYGEVSGLLVEAIKELSLKVSIQDEEIRKLKESKAH